jgi:hypothetical protein
MKTMKMKCISQQVDRPCRPLSFIVASDAVVQLYSELHAFS